MYVAGCSGALVGMYIIFLLLLLSCKPPSPKMNEVVLDNFRFNPDSLNITLGDTVTWIHRQGQSPHTVTSGMNGNFDESFDSRAGVVGARMREPDRFTVVFEIDGEFHYFCIVHGARGMTGIIVVDE